VTHTTDGKLTIRIIGDAGTELLWGMGARSGARRKLLMISPSIHITGDAGSELLWGWALRGVDGFELLCRFAAGGYSKVPHYGQRSDPKKL